MWCKKDAVQLLHSASATHTIRQTTCLPRTKMAVMDGARLSTTFVRRLEQNLTTALQAQSHQPRSADYIFTDNTWTEPYHRPTSTVTSTSFSWQHLHSQDLNRTLPPPYKHSHINLVQLTTSSLTRLEQNLTTALQAQSHQPRSADYIFTQSGAFTSTAVPRWRMSN